MLFYRYDSYLWNTDFLGNVNIKIVLTTFDMIRETPKGYWIDDNIREKWVSKTAKKRYAYPSKEEAMKSFLARKKRQSITLKTQVKVAKASLKEGREMLGKGLFDQPKKLIEV